MTQNFEDRLPYLLRRVSSALAQPVDGTLRRFGLTHTQLGVLAQLDLVAPRALSGATLGQRNGVTAQSVSSAIAGLADLGMVHREPHPTHGRIVEVSITAQGSAHLAKALTAIWRAEDRALAFMDDAGQEEMRRVLRWMMQQMDLYLYSSESWES